jgi:hypothetical protein
MAVSAMSVGISAGENCVRFRASLRFRPDRGGTKHAPARRRRSTMEQDERIEKLKAEVNQMRATGVDPAAALELELTSHEAN